MLKSLNISNLILIEQAQVPFAEGFNVLTGETGAGKSAILAAIRLICGARADSAVVRKGAAKARVEACFSPEPRLKETLEQLGIDWDGSDEILITREVSSSGGSRAFINNQGVTLAALKEVGAFLVKCVGQHAQQQLLSAESQRALLDRYGGVEPVRRKFADTFRALKECSEALLRLRGEETERLRRLESLKRELEEIDAVSPQEDEEESLFQEYTLLTNAEEYADLLKTLSEGLEGEYGALPLLLSLRSKLQEAGEIDASLEPNIQGFQTALLELQDVAATLEQKGSALEANPKRLGEVDGRLKELHRLKKIYGPEIKDVLSYAEKGRAQILAFEGADQEIALLESRKAALEKECDRGAAELTKLRKAQGVLLSKSVTKALQKLNMPKAEFSVRLERTLRSEQGEDAVSFILAPNPGEKAVEVSESASGGELSRVMLALQSELSGKEEVASVLFDEIDSGIGGHTSTLVGQMLREIGSRHQVIAVTHFPQVASCALHHLQISKCTSNERTVTTVKPLEGAAKEQELSRMVGLSSALV